MAFSYTNRQGKTYYLHVGPKRGGGLQHYLSTKKKGELAEALPAGFEVYESVNGPVYLRRKKPSLIEDSELACIQKSLERRRGSGHRYMAEVREDTIIIHEAKTDYGWVRELNPF